MLSYDNAGSIIQTAGRCQVNNGMAYYHNQGDPEGKRKRSATFGFAKNLIYMRNARLHNKQYLPKIEIVLHPYGGICFAD